MYNYTCLIGRLVSDPEITETDSGKKLCHITLAVQRTFKNSDGIYEVDYIKCTLWDAIASNTTEYCHKGDLIAVRGQLRNNNYVAENDQKKYSTEVIVEKVCFLSTKNETTKKEN